MADLPFLPFLFFLLPGPVSLLGSVGAILPRAAARAARRAVAPSVAAGAGGALGEDLT